MIVGYARTSTIDQQAGLDAQLRDLKAACVEKVFAEQVSSIAQRTKLAAALEFVREGDVLMVTKPDTGLPDQQGTSSTSSRRWRRAGSDW